MGNQVSRRTTTTTGKVIFSDGTVQTLDQDNPTSVAELMLDHPQHIVVEFQPPPKSKPTTSTDSKTTPLPADHKLDPTKIYVMLPMKRARTTSMGTIAQIVKEQTKDREVLLGKSSTNISVSNLPLLLMMMRCGADSATAVVSTNTCLVLRSEKGSGNKDDCLGLEIEEKKELKEEEDDDDELLLKENQMKPEFMNTQFSSKRWKPNLDPIEEKVKSNRALIQWLL